MMEFNIRSIKFNDFESDTDNYHSINEFNSSNNVANNLSCSNNHLNCNDQLFLLNQNMNNNFVEENFNYFYEQILNEDLNNNDQQNHSFKQTELINSIDNDYQSQNNQSEINSFLMKSFSSISNLAIESKNPIDNCPQEIQEQQQLVINTNQIDHQLIQMTSKVFICNWIGCTKNIYSTLKDLVIHIEYCHIDQQRYSGENFICHWTNCNRNGKPFDQRYKLINHMRTHSGDKPKKCPMLGCEKMFSRQENLKIHIRSHTNDKPYRCLIDDCKKAFSNSSDRAKHRRTHFSAKPWACQFPNCNKRYTDPSSLRKHRKQQHHYVQASNLTNDINHNQWMDPLSKSWSVTMNNNDIKSNMFNLEKTWSNSIFNDFLHNKQPKTVENLLQNNFNQNNLQFDQKRQISSNIDVNPIITVDKFNESMLNFKNNSTYQSILQSSDIVSSIKNDQQNQEQQIYSTNEHRSNVLDWFECI